MVTSRIADIPVRSVPRPCPRRLIQFGKWRALYDIKLQGCRDGIIVGARGSLETAQQDGIAAVDEVIATTHRTVRRHLTGNRYAPQWWPVYASASDRSFRRRRGSGGLFIAAGARLRVIIVADHVKTVAGEIRY